MSSSRSACCGSQRHRVPQGTGPDVLRVLELFAECKGQQPGKPSILYYHRPHLGSNRLPETAATVRALAINAARSTSTQARVVSREKVMGEPAV